MLNPSEWKTFERILRVKQPLPGVKPSTLQVHHDRSRGASMGTPISRRARNRSSVSSRDIVEEVARNRRGEETSRFRTSALRGTTFDGTGDFAKSFLGESPKPRTRIVPTEDPIDDSIYELPSYLGVGNRYLPLDYFVIQEEDGSSLLTRGRELGKCMGRTVYQNPRGEVSWVPAEVLDYDKESKRFTIQIQCDKSIKYVRRFNILFDFEDSELFFKNREAAIKERHVVRKRITTDLFISTRMTELYETNGMDLKTLDGIFKKIGIDLEKFPKKSIDDYLGQIHAMHDYGLLKGILHYFWNEPRIQEAMRGLEVNPPPPVVYVDYDKIPRYTNFTEIQTYMKKKSLWADPYALTCLQAEQFSYSDYVSRQPLFESPVELPVNLEQFMKAQEITISRFENAVHGMWLASFSSSFIKLLAYKVDMEAKTLKYTKLPRRIRRILAFFKIKIECDSALAVEKGLKSLRDFLYAFAIRNSSLIDGKPELIKCQPQPFIQITMKVVEKKKGFKVIAEPSIESVYKQVWSLAEQMAETVSNMDSIEAWVFSMLEGCPRDVLSNINLDEHPRCAPVANEIKQLLSKGLKGAEGILSGLKTLEYVFNTTRETVLTMIDNDYVPKKPPMFMKQEMYYRISGEILEKVEVDYWNLQGNYVDFYDFGVFSVDCSSAKRDITTAALKLKHDFSSEFKDDITSDIRTFHGYFQEMKDRASQECNSIDEVSATIDYMRTSIHLVGELKKNVFIVEDKYKAIDAYQIFLDQKVLLMYFELYYWPRYMKEYFKKRKKELAKANERLVQEMEEQKLKLRDTIAKYADMLEKFKEYGLHNKGLNIDYVIRVTEEGRDLKSKLKNLKEEVDIINRREAIIGMEPSEYSELNQLMANSETYFELWELVYEFQTLLPVWFESPLNKLDVETVYSSVSVWIKLLTRLDEFFVGNKKQTKLLKHLNNELDSFKEFLPLMSSITTPGMRDRHWREIREKLEVDISADLQFSLNLLIGMGLNNSENLTLLIEIAERASKEMAIEKTLDTLDNEWYKKEFSLVMYKNLYILTKAEDLQMQVDEHVMKVQTLKSSPFVGPFRDRVTEWERTLKLLTDLLNEWMRVTRYWVYLDPIFSSSELAAQMQSEARRFANVDADIKKMVQVIYDSKSIMACAGNEMFIAYFAQCNEECERILKSLRHYLEKKRDIFPRFFFLSDDEMLDLMSNTNNPRLVQKQIHKCFHGIHTLIFDNEDNVLGLRSLEKEEVKFVGKVQNSQMLEEWLCFIEEQMTKTLFHLTKESLKQQKKRYPDWPNQVNLLRAQINFCSIVTDILRGEGFQALFEDFAEDEDVIDVPRRNAPRERFFAEFLRRIEKEIVNVVALVRSSVKTGERNSYTNLAMKLINHKDSMGIVSRCSNHLDFDWQIQLRHYLQEDGVNVQCISINFPYRFEYAATSERLVITTLTERAQRCMLLSMHLRYAGSPQGPAGTGKTETTKELARELGVFCLVFNCSEELDAFSMASFFKGLVICGAWSCFDEFNRIDEEVLSMISQQILTLALALRAGDPECEFEGSTVTLNPCFSVYVTMNPEYEGRTQVPDSLKNLLRPIAMMEPDFTMIAEISLYSCGFSNARILANKIIAVFRLCSEQLSSQAHYDFGLRTLKSVLVGAARLRTQVALNPNESISIIKNIPENPFKPINRNLEHSHLPLEVEEELVVRSLMLSNRPKLVGQDIKIFENVIEDIFRGTPFTNRKDSKLHGAVNDLIQEQKLSESPQFFEKVAQVYDTLHVRHGIMLIGDSMTGKTTTMRLLYEALNRLKVNEIMEKVFQWSHKEPEAEEMGNVKSIIFAFKELQIDIDSVEEERLRDTLPFISVQRLKELRNRCEYPGVIQFTINPKAYSMSRLFGYFDEQTREWHDGLIATLLRKLSLEVSKRLKWLVFDGPVSTQWVENLNTALDDNRKLCLTSGESIRVSQETAILFEVDSLEHASPATVSRLGMIYFDNEYLPPTDVFQRYTQKQMPEVLFEYGPKFEHMFHWLAMPCFSILKHCEFSFQFSENWLLSCFIKLLDNLLDMYRDPEVVKGLIGEPGDEGQGLPGAMKAQSLEGMEKISIKAAAHIESCFIFAVIWTFGAVLSSNVDRDAFDDFMRERIGLVDTTEDTQAVSNVRQAIGSNMEEVEAQSYFQIPPDTVPRPEFMTPLKRKFTVFDIIYEKDKREWIAWHEFPFEHLQQNAAEPPPNTEAPAPELLIVPTVEIIRTSYFLEAYARTQQHVLITGPTGTGKSVLLKQYVRTRLTVGKIFPLLQSFTAATTPETIQKKIESRLEKYRKGVLTTYMGKALVVVAEDINMASQDNIESQPTLEFLRQYFDHSGWYDQKFSDYYKIENLFFVAALTPKVGTSRNISLRILRHFALLSLAQPSDKTFKEIFGMIFTELCTKFPERASRGMDTRVVEATLELYRKVEETFKPTPSRIHYAFNIRDVSTLFKGMSICNTKTLRKKEHLIRLWYHEALRTFYDRLTDYADRYRFLRLLDDLTVENFKSIASAVVEEPMPDLGDEIDPKEAEEIIGKRAVPIYGVLFRGSGGFLDYMEIRNIETANESLRLALEKYNQEKPHMNIIIFDYVAEHLLRICRVIKSPQTHSLLVGVGGSGKHSLAKLAAFMFAQDLHSIELRHQYSPEDWLEDMKKIIFAVGSEEKKGVFVIDETQIIEEKYLEDINNFLNSGEIPQLFSPDEMSDLLGKSGSVTEVDKMKMWTKFVKTCKDNLTILICMSPIGSKFRQRVRMFPALASCTVIDWFLEWPDEGLAAVAHYMLERITEVPVNLQTCVTNVCVKIFNDIKTNANELMTKEGRYIYTTPISFIYFLNTFDDLLSKKRESIEYIKRRYENSIALLQKTKENLKVLQASLQAQEGDLARYEHELTEILKVIEEQGGDLAKQQQLIGEEEAVASEKAQRAEEMKNQCQAQLDAVMPDLEIAKDSLKKISKNEITELKSLGKPPAGIKLVMEAVCLILKVPPTRYKKAGVFVEDYWMAAMGKKVLSDPKILDRLVNFDKGSIPKNTTEKLETMIKNPEFRPEVAEHASIAAKGMCIWVRALVQYNFVQREIKPKEKALQTAQKECEQLKKELKHKKKELSTVQNKLKVLIDEQKKKEEEREVILDTMKRNKRKIERAEKLIGGLGGEMQRWIVTTRTLQSNLANLVGDVLMSAGFVNFLGLFPNKYRERSVEKWQTIIAQQGVNSSDTFSLISMLGEAVQIRDWITHDLPNDEYSIENALILENSLKYSICIDPQSQAYNWLRSSHEKLTVTRFIDPKFISVIETSIQFGLPVVIQVDEYIDPVVLPLLNKEKQKSGNIRFSEMELKYSPDFRLFMVTRLNNPHYHPELSAVINLLNFQITAEGLYEQILSLIVASEKKELEERHMSLVKQTTANKRELKNLEAQIVNQLSEYEGDILEDEELVAHLHNLKQTAEDITTRLRNSEKTEKRINQARDTYAEVSGRVVSLFFSVNDMGKIKRIYQFSLKWFLNHCSQVLRNTTDNNDDEKRVAYLILSMTRHIFLKVCASLYEKDKPLFALLLSFKIIHAEESISEDLINFLLNEGIDRIEEESPVPLIPDDGWSRIRELSSFYPFKSPALYTTLQQTPEEWKAILESQHPEQEPIPGSYHLSSPADMKADLKQKEEDPAKRGKKSDTVSDYTRNIFVTLQRLCVLKCLRSEKLASGYEQLINYVLGPEYLQSDPGSLENGFDESTAHTAFLLFHNHSSNPIAEIHNLDHKIGLRMKIKTLSMGAGKIDAAKKLLQHCKARGYWLVLQNIHLGSSFLPFLEEELEAMQLGGEINKDFRLWLTSSPQADLSISILQTTIKQTLEPVAGLKVSLLSLLNKSDSHVSEGEDIHRKLLFGLCFAHASIEERLRFGPTGWSKPYDFTESDLFASISTMLYLSQGSLPWEMLRFCIVDLTYGGRVSENEDQKLLHALIDPILSTDMLAHDFRLSNVQNIRIPDSLDSLKSMFSDVEAMEFEETPEIYGLHSNCAVSLASQESQRVLSNIAHVRKSALLIEDTDTKHRKDKRKIDTDIISGQQRGQMLIKLTSSILDSLPEDFDIQQVAAAYPIVYEESLNTVLQQEVTKYSHLLTKVRTTTKALLRAASGLSVMTIDLEQLASFLILDRVPYEWLALSYPTSKPLAGYVRNLVKRTKYIHKWIAEGHPKIFWFPGLFYPQAFLTALLQNHSRRNSLNLETLRFKNSVDTDSEEGHLMDGFYLEGASYEDGLQESRYKEFCFKMPPVRFIPTQDEQQTDGVYICPLYKTSIRAKAEGGSSNLVCSIQLKTDVPSSYWVKRGVALICENPSLL